jgi:hypothetical protein
MNQSIADLLVLFATSYTLCIFWRECGLLRLWADRFRQDIYDQWESTIKDYRHESAGYVQHPRKIEFRHLTAAMSFYEIYFVKLYDILNNR